MKAKKRLATSALALCVLGLMSAPAKAVDLVGEYDATVVSIHDFSVINGTITTKASSATVQAAVSKMNKQLFTIKTALVTFDKDLAKNWTYLSPTSNTTYPARTTFRSYDLAAYSWYSFELSQQQAITNCYTNKMRISSPLKDSEERVGALLRHDQATNNHGKVENRRRPIIYRPAFERAVGPAFEIALTKES